MVPCFWIIYGYIHVTVLLSITVSNLMTNNGPPDGKLRLQYKTDYEMFKHHITQYNGKQLAKTNLIKMKYKFKKRRWINGYEEGRKLKTRRDGPVDDDPCAPFQNHEADHKIYHPGHPGNYASNIDCVTTIITTRGKVIKLDFRDFFEIENPYNVLEAVKNCSQDYIEVRDGQYGFDNRLLKWCGTEFPKVVTSTGPYMWLKFHSDETSEYRGFHAEYEFVASTASRKQPQSCFHTLTGHYGVIKKDDFDQTCIEHYEKYNLTIDVLYKIVVDEGWQILLNFTYFSLAEPYDCEKNFIDIFANKTEIPNRIQRFCGTIARTLIAETTEIYLRYYAVPAAKKSNFSADFTAFRRSNSCIVGEELDCEDTTCIKRQLLCDGTVNCIHKVDEDPDICLTNYQSTSHSWCLSLVVLSLILNGIVIVFFLKRRLKKRYHDPMELVLKVRTTLH